jgi:hypothetical protein
MIVSGQKWAGMSVDDWEWLEIGRRKWGQSKASAFVLKWQKTAQSSQYWVNLGVDSQKQLFLTKRRAEGLKRAISVASRC